MRATLSSAGDGPMTFNSKTNRGVRSDAIIHGGADLLVFSNVEPGTTTVTLNAPGCRPRFPDITHHPVEAGALSMIEMNCPAQ